MKHGFDHLNQTTTIVKGPIQDDEAILLYGLVRTMGLKYIVELGGLNGYSAQNFVKAISGQGKVISIDPNFTNKYNIPTDNFTFIRKKCQDVFPKDLNIPRIDLLFFDCHALRPQIEFFDRCLAEGLITNNTVLVLHDTDVHPARKGLGIKQIDNNHKTRGNTGIYPIQTALAERQMVNIFMDKGYVPLHAHCDYRDLPDYIQIRHGLTILSKPYKLLH